MMGQRGAGNGIRAERWGQRGQKGRNGSIPKFVLNNGGSDSLFVFNIYLYGREV